MKLIITCIALLSIIQVQPQERMKEIRKNDMIVRWEIEKEEIHFEMEAPTDGWVTIGFNETTSLAGTYLLMGRVRNGKAEIVEHYTDRPGSYKPITDYGVPSQIAKVSGDEKGNATKLCFSIPIKKASKYHKELSLGTKWNLLLAYSLDDDFQHHSIMRTSTTVEL